MNRLIPEIGQKFRVAFSDDVYEAVEYFCAEKHYDARTMKPEGAFWMSKDIEDAEFVRLVNNELGGSVSVDQITELL